MRIGVIGAGSWGSNIIRNLAELGELAAVCDPTPEKLAGWGRAYPRIQTHAGYRDLLASPVPAVAIATPTPLHFEIAEAALRAGKDVYVEKPLTHERETTAALVDLAAAQQRILMVGHLLLYQPAMAWIRDYLASGALGELFAIRHERLNLGRARSVENVLWDIGVHDMAVMLYLVGDTPSHIRASGHRMLRLGVEDEVHVHLEFANGIRGNLHVSWLWPETTRRTIIRGAAGMLVYDEMLQTVTLHRKWIDNELANHDEGSEVVHRGHGQPLKLELAHFLARIEDRKPPLSDGYSALAVIETLERISAALARSGAGH
ncbi:MAG: Gfo/Idh/MocA family oxidoreductase [Salinisphaera sp.]|nr:Gfo/Idh/MocA family oxidoreductase [Salinisphaera sp.]